MFRLILLLPLVVVIGIVFWMFDENSQIRTVDRLEQQVDLAESSHDPDYFMENFTYLGFNKSGQADFKLDAVYMEHYPSDDTSFLTDPLLTLYRKDEAPWQARSLTAKVWGDAEKVLLQREVFMQRKLDSPLKGSDKTSKNKPKFTEISSEEMMLVTATKYAETYKPVTMRTENSVNDSIGAYAWLDRDYIQLLDKARGIHVAH